MAVGCRGIGCAFCPVGLGSVVAMMGLVDCDCLVGIIVVLVLRMINGSPTISRNRCVRGLGVC